ncbi:MAG TPA: cytoplasmic protein [Syntrophobacteraceae bacterium]|nr:cytoplasmic protein [Syntrophobacteraceae bacterium]
MTAHKHTIVEEYDGMVAFGLSREIDEKSLICYLQKFSDDDLMRVLAPRLSDEEINRISTLILELMRNHLSDREYHRLFLKDDDDNRSERMPQGCD